MFDIGWSEMAIIMLLALMIIGPKDLPRVARSIGQWVRKGRMLAREFQTSLEDMAKEAELDDVKKEIEKIGKTDLSKAVEKTIDPKGELTKAFDTSSDQSPTQAKSSDIAKKAPNGHVEAKASGKDQAASPPSKANADPKNAKPTAKTTKPAAPKKPAAPRKRSPKPGSSATSGGVGDQASTDEGSGAAMAVKTS